MADFHLPEYNNMLGPQLQPAPQGTLLGVLDGLFAFISRIRALRDKIRSRRALGLHNWWADPIINDAFREPEDVTEALDSAEQLIYNVSNNTLKQHLAQTRQELSTALYQNDAATRVIARITKERDEAREALSNVTISGGAQGDAMQVDNQGLPQDLIKVVDDTQQE